MHRPVGRAVTRSSLEREVRGSNLGPVKSDTVLPTARHRCNISSKGAVLPGRNDAEMGPANSLHASAYYSEYKWKIWFEVYMHQSLSHLSQERAKVPSGFRVKLPPAICLRMIYHLKAGNLFKGFSLRHIK